MWTSGKFTGQIKRHYGHAIVKSYIECGEPKLARAAAKAFAARGLPLNSILAKQLGRLESLDWNA